MMTVIYWSLLLKLKFTPLEFETVERLSAF